MCKPTQLWVILSFLYEYYKNLVFFARLSKDTNIYIYEHIFIFMSAHTTISTSEELNVQQISSKHLIVDERVVYHWKK